ncbi:MAG: PaaI family thioesterase [Acidimicrobiales bacterium]
MVERPTERATRMNEFFGPKAPGLHGAVFDYAAPDEVRGHIDVSDALIAGTGFLFAPAIVSLADTLCAIGCGANIPEGASFTTVELKVNFLGSAREGERVSAIATPLHLGHSTQVWDVDVRNDTKDRTIAAFRCTQMVLHPR